MKLAILAVPMILAFGSAYAGDNASSTATPAACSADAQKYCTSSTTDADKQSCLHTNMDKLSDACRTAMNASQGEQGQNQPSGY